MKLLTYLHQITDISGPPDFSRNTIQLTLFDLYIRTLLASKHNQIYSEASSTRFSAINLLCSRLPMKLLTYLHQITDISGPPDFSRNTIQLTLFDLYIRTLLASKRNQIYSEASSTRFSAINLLCLRLTMKLLTDLHQITDISGQPDFSRNTIQLTLFDLYIRTLLASKRNQIYSESSSTRISDHHLTYTYALTNQNLHESQSNHRHFRQP